MMEIKYIPSSVSTNSTFRMFFHILDIFFYVIYLIFMYCLYCVSSIRIISVSFIICFSPTFFTLRMSFTFCFVFPGEFFFVLPLFTFCTLFFHKIKIKVEALGDEPQALGFSDPRATTTYAIPPSSPTYLQLDEAGSKTKHTSQSRIIRRPLKNTKSVDKRFV